MSNTTQEQNFISDVNLTDNDKSVVKKLRYNEELSKAERLRIVTIVYPGYCKRQHKIEKTSSNGPKTKNKKIQTKFQKESFTQTVADTASQDAVTDLQNIHKKHQKFSASDGTDLSEEQDLLDETYLDRRNFILINQPQVKELKKKYPFLFSAHDICNELDRIFNDKNKSKSFLQNISKYASIILDFAIDDDPLVKKITEKNSRYKELSEKKYATDVGAILILSSIMEENRSYLKLQDHDSKTNVYPFILAPCGEENLLDLEAGPYLVNAENILVCACDDFREAFLCLMAAYFVFDITYQPDCFNTLVVAEQLLLKEKHTANYLPIEDKVDQLVIGISAKEKLMFKRLALTDWTDLGTSSSGENGII